jgi:hypothetical protein
MMTSYLPRRPRGRPSVAAEERYQAEVAEFCQKIRETRSRLDFSVSARGWGYILEGEGIITKGDLDGAERLINEYRKDGLLPLDICAVDETRVADCLERIDDTTALEEAECVFDHVRSAHMNWTPFSFWEDLDVYIEIGVEKIDLKNLFKPICKQFRTPITNIKDWYDINARAAMMERFASWEAKGKQCVLLLCGDHDPRGLSISSFMRSNLADLAKTVGWSPENLVIERFGLNYDFIRDQGLLWIDNLETWSGKRLDDPRHPDHWKEYVQGYLRQYGVRRVEANALVVRPEAGRALCGQAILRYVPAEAVEEYEAKLEAARAELADRIDELLKRMAR